MRNYETIVIFKTAATEAAVSTITKKIEKVLTKKPGKIAKKDEWGNKTLAYPIKKEKQGKYVVWHFNAEPKTIAELDKALRYEEDVLRYITHVADEELEKHLAEKKAKKAEKPEAGEDSRNNRDTYDVFVDYKDLLSLARYISDRGKITPRRVSGVSAKSQRRISQAVKRARQIALLSYTDGVYIERPQYERNDRSERGERGERHERGERSERGERHERGDRY
ncbi:MAG: 30S ribosomal protein S18 [Proteobacteria bacterium]|jgi:small subunit ribosomal protein S6|nr:30S ribosomal protein S18 [Pseudomonadota bacterium]